MFTETEAVILRQVKATQGRRMILMFSQKYGKISVGTNMSESKGKNKAALSIRPFVHGRYELFKNRDYYNLNGSEVIKSYFAFGEDVDKYFCASYALELTEKLLPEEVPQPRLFSILVDFLNALEKRKGNHETLVLCYMVKLLKEFGAMPEIRACTSCGKTEKLVAFSVPEGGAICADCAEKKEESGSNDKLIFTAGFDILGVIEYFANKPISSFEKVALNEETAARLMDVLKEYFSYHLDVSGLKSETVSWMKYLEVE